MNDPFNQLPTDPDWIRKVDAMGVQAHETLGCSVVMIAVQDNGKLAVCIEGVPDASTLGAFLRAGGVPYLLEGLGVMCAAMDIHAKTQVPQ